jgi:ParB family chromosome partitioning protein
VARRSGLGRGLGALIPTDITGDAGSGLREVPVGLISPNPHQPRAYFDEEALASLTASVSCNRSSSARSATIATS